MFDWKMAVFILQCVSTIVTITAFLVIKFNDIRHLTMYVEEMKKDVSNVKRYLKKVSDKVIKIDTRCQERHKK